LPLLGGSGFQDEAQMIGELSAQVLMQDTLTTSANGAAVDMATVNMSGAFVLALLTTTKRTYSGSPSIVFEIQQDDDSSFSNPETLATFSAIETTDAVDAVTYLSPTRRYLRSVATFSAAADTGDYTLTLIGNRRTTLPSLVVPHFSSAEIGTIDDKTAAVTFDTDVASDDFTAGVTIKVNDEAVTISAAEQQTNHAITYYTITPAVEAGDVVTWEYAKASGHIVAESGGAALESVDPQTVTNNVTGGDLPTVPGSSARIGLLASDFAALEDGASIGDTWSSHSGHHFMRGAGALGLTKGSMGEQAHVYFNGVDDFMPSDYFDDLTSFTVLAVVKTQPNFARGELFGKGSYSSGGAYDCSNEYAIYGEQDETGAADLSVSLSTDLSTQPAAADFAIRILHTTSIIDPAATNFLVNDSTALLADHRGHSPESILSPLSWTLGQLSDLGGNFGQFQLRAFLIYSPALSPSSMTTVIEWLKNQCGVAFGVSPLLSATLKATGEINSHIVIWFDTPVYSTDFAAGVTIRVNGEAQEISASKPNTDDWWVQYSLTSRGVLSGDVIDFAYDSAIGDINNGSTPLPSIPITNVVNWL
jgi:hypothetical protein